MTPQTADEKALVKLRRVQNKAANDIERLQAEIRKLRARIAKAVEALSGKAEGGAK